MKCTKCGTEFNEGVFCPECGEKMGATESETKIKEEAHQFELERQKKELDFELERKRREYEIELERKRIENAQLDAKRKEDERLAAERERLDREKAAADIALTQEKVTIARIEREKAEANLKAERTAAANQRRIEQAPHRYGVISLVFGIISVITFGYLLFSPILGIVFAMKSKTDGKMTTEGKAGFICSLISFAILIIVIVLAVVLG